MAAKKFCVIGLGHFGLNLSLRLAESGAEVLAIDNHQDKIDLISDKVTFAVCMNSSDDRALRSLNLQEMDAVIVAIGESFESSLLTTAILQEIGVKKIFVRIISQIHERLLKLMNIEDMLVPEADAAYELASKLLIPGVLESFSIHKDFGIYEIKAPKQFIKKTIIELNLRNNYSLNLVTIKRQVSKRGLLTLGQKEQIQVIGVPSPDTEILQDDILVLFGREKDVKNLLEE